ncbi:hypothetical protein CERSUDRAFT_99296 [Gelatoporia subvermispora B]|uniref:H/ACA ribonucleoprotein complex non-core subunit NAF1 n=1 Tax=Ceriporiopsis subvermispora (strain B) TaxID=914234 RepID=M2R125_CERS8|nr:hypothetical protein CERSUDRAFT_99296 [Gelatoporia subvermispora B]
MASELGFKVPSIVAQDLRLIQDIIGEIPVPSSSKTSSVSGTTDDPDIASSDSDTDSEQEVEADIFNGPLDDDVPAPSDTTSDSDDSSDSSSSSGSDSDIEDEPTKTSQAPASQVVDADDDEEAGPAGAADTLLKTKNEILDTPIIIPEIEEVGPLELLEKVGEVMSIVDKVVIVKGLPSELANRASEQALDSDTLLVFEDRKVLGYIYETFGPTTQPLYQVRFNDQYPLDLTKVQVSRPVFHVPERSRFVFVRQLKRFKGSDASNVNDEEPAEDELEFSDDEQEAAHKRSLAQRRERTRAGSVVSSRHATPTPSQMRDQDMTGESYGANPYDDASPYGMDYGAGPSRPAPIPYDDPYSDSYGISEPQQSTSTPPPRLPEAPTDPYVADEEPSMSGSFGDHGRGRGRGRGPMRGARGGARDTRGRGRGRDRDRRQGTRGRGRGYGTDRSDRAGPYGRRPSHSGSLDDSYDPRRPRSMSPTSLAIARATGQYADGSPIEPDVRPGAPAAPGANALHSASEGSWSYPQHAAQDQQQYSDFSYGYQQQPYQQPYVQPHINPRFASAFAMQFGYAQGGQYSEYDSYSYGGGYGNGAGEASQASREWSEEWNGTRRPSESREGSWTGGTS